MMDGNTPWSQVSAECHCDHAELLDRLRNSESTSNQTQRTNSDASSNQCHLRLLILELVEASLNGTHMENYQPIRSVA